MSQPTSGMNLQVARTRFAIDSLQGDLLAITLLRSTALRSDVAFQERKKLWNSMSRLTTGVVKSIGVTDINSLESSLARELVGWASRGI
jgi:hypothetical protein